MAANETNGVNAMLAHSWRAGDDNNFVRSVIESYMFLGFGVVIKIDDERMTVDCGWCKFTNVELMVLGVDGWGIKMLPAVNDRVLLLTTQVPVKDLKTFTASGSMPPYDLSGVKAIPLTDSSSAQLITIDKDGIVVTGDNQLTVNADGIHVEDVNGNTVDMTDGGVEVLDLNGNNIKATEDGIHVQDLNDNIIDMTSSGFSLTDANGNTFVGDSSNGIVINGNLQVKPSTGDA
jgi:hypothetical protein